MTKSIVEYFTQDWDNKITEWYKSPNLFFDNHVSPEVYKLKSKGKYKLQPEFLPEPYIGDPYKCSAVVINKNPGNPHMDLQHFEKGRFIVTNKAHTSYSKFAFPFPYLSDTENENNGSKWWNKRINWINLLLGKESTNKPFALELCPWHSQLFGKANIKSINKFAHQVNNEVFNIAEAASVNANLKMILTVGSLFTDIFNELSFREVIAINHTNFKEHNINNWPISKKTKKPTQVYFSIWQSKSGINYFNFRSGSNYNSPPAKHWQEVQKQVIAKAL